MSSSALPLKVPATPSRSTETDKDKTPVVNSKQATSTKPSAIVPKDISSPHELTAFVENLLEQLDTKFDEMSNQILDRMNQMSSRVDALEASIQDIINGDIPASPSPVPGTPGMKRNDSGFH
ncbi:hypothetical protein CC1G_10041 [Coprinopsis cinerea okayama7|uniref:Heat shock factor binding protein 1 n=1 Tax=Coprinopsis cinerea (strain Okayama-7 / 130 / ATCC MYA-4618 / FGSC 9003) TaxID=240176 RepID=A8NUW2_COPC7|nr:hypothetical protein CC1G_10041 [Coprinopsis cinerea okayama7\|eukprot:XP_001836547.1 hypothetical protein CC1G_10041 [Coprinopsis cinerea okayama7\